MLGTLFTIPSATNVVSSTGVYSTVWFNELLPVIYFVLGILVAVLVIKWLSGTVKGGLKRMFGGGRRGRGRRR
jgi:hypothetical protein